MNGKQRGENSEKSKSNNSREGQDEIERGKRREVRVRSGFNRCNISLLVTARKEEERRSIRLAHSNWSSERRRRKSKVEEDASKERKSGESETEVSDG